MSLLHVVSASRGKISIVDFISHCNSTIDEGTALNSVDLTPETFNCVLSKCDNINISESESKGLIFIAGFVAFKILKNYVECDLCKSELITEYSLELELSAESTSY